MSFDSELRALLSPLVDGRVTYRWLPDTPVYPLIVYSVVGGKDEWYLEKKLPSHINERIQLTAMSRSAVESKNFLLQARKIICESDFIAEPIGGGPYEGESLIQAKVFVMHYDLSIWHLNPYP